jgi:TatA/E family protein of Tat protein translocase
MFGLGMAEVAVILVIGLFLFGNRLPEIARWLGRTVVEFRREANSLTEELRAPGKTGL